MSLKPEMSQKTKVNKTEMSIKLNCKKKKKKKKTMSQKVICH